MLSEDDQGKIFREPLETTVPYGKYCKTGKRIMREYGSASIEMDEHIIGCGQCSTALQLETPLPAN